jgi:hypothetical protein
VLAALAAVSTILPSLPRPTLPQADQSAALVDVSAADALERAAVSDLVPLSAADSQIAPGAIDTTQPGLAARVQQETAERSALDKLSSALGQVSAGQPAADSIQRGDFPAAKDQLSNLGDEADQLSDAAKQQLAKSLQQAANATASTDRQLADRERQAAQALGRTTYADQRQALKNLADQVERSGARGATADQLARDVGRLQQQEANSGQGTRGQGQGQSNGPQSATPGSSQAQQGADAGGAGGAGDSTQQGGPGVGTGSNPDVLGDPAARLDAAGQSVTVPTKLGNGAGVRPTDGSEDQTGTDSSAANRAVAELVQAQQTGQVTPEQNLVQGDQRPIVRGYFR